MSEIRFMRRALELAQLGRTSVSPNPMVGCVIVHNEKIIGEGYHQFYGKSHAEVNAINSVEDKSLLPESTVYVTLEPCAHYGKTPPCSDLLIEKNVNKVVIACQDPFSRVDGKGVDKLRKAGINIKLGLLENEAKDLNKRFFTYHQKKRPYVILKWAQTSDGFIAKSNNDSKWISNTYSRQLVHKWRTKEDAILVGKNTALHDNPSLNVRVWEGKNPIRILMDSNLEVPSNYNLLDGTIKTIIINKEKDVKNENIHWIRTDTMHPKEILKKLYEEKIQSVIVEGGSQLLNSFIEEGCWDEARVFISEKNFNKGIPAPYLNGSIIEETFVQNNRLIFYQNHG